MTDLYQCPDCGREYRADKLAACPGCQHDTQMTLNATPFLPGPRGSDSAESAYVPRNERKPRIKDRKSFLAVLFNYKFDDFVFVRVARVFYLCILILSGLLLAAYELALVINFFKVTKYKIGLI